MRTLQILCALLLTGVASPSLAADLGVGQPAPDFALPDQNGKIHRLADSRGKITILAFYPKDMTPGCTCEMEALRDQLATLQQRNAVVYGISADDVASHRRFADKLHLNFPILADPEKKVILAYGVLGKNGVADRVTFIIDRSGRIMSIDRAVNAQFVRQGGVLISRHALNLALALSDWKAEIGKPVPDFSLPAVGGRTVQLYEVPKKAYVVVFVSKNCPVSRAYIGRLKQLASDPAYADIAFLAVNSNSDEPMAEVEADARQNQYPFPVAKDTGNVIADHFQAKATPTVWVMNSDRIAVYRGAIDDNQDEARATHHYLKDALDAVLAGKPVAIASTLAFGCAVHRARPATP